MEKQRLLGRAQARQGRISRKAKRGIVRDGGRIRLASSPTIADSVTITNRGAVVETNFIRTPDGNLVAKFRSRIEQDGLADKMREAIGGNRHTDQTGALGNVEVQYVAAKSYLQVRLKTDTHGKLRPAKERLLELACELDFGCRSANGPTCYEDAGRVWIKLKADPPMDGDCPIVRELRAGGWKQYHSDRRVFCKKSTVLRQTWAVGFCERHSGEWWTLSKVSREAVDRLYRSVDWCELFERTRSLPSTGTNEHARQFHKWRKPVSRNKLSDGYNGINREVRGGRAEDGIGYEMVKEPCPLPKMRHAGINYNREQVGEILPDGARVIYRPSRRQFGYVFGENGTKLPFGS